MKKENKKQPDHSRLWKIIAISMIVLFAVFVAAGMLKAHNIRSSFKKPTQEQVDYAIKVAAEKLQAEGIEVSNLTSRAGSMVRNVRDNRPGSMPDRAIIQVSFYNDTASYTALIDVGSGEVVMHTNSMRYKGFDSSEGRTGYAPMPPCRIERDNGGCRSRPWDRE